MRRWFVLFALLCWSPLLVAQERVALHLFWSETCAHCVEAKRFVEGITTERPWVDVELHEISRSPAAASRFERMAAEAGYPAEAVPSLIYCGVMDVGWDPAQSGPWLLARLDDCFARGGSLADGDASEPVMLPGIGAIDPSAVSLPAFTTIIAALDAFNPCAFFVLLFLLSLLANQHDRRRVFAIGGLFVLASGVMYFAFMAAWLNVFQLVGALTGITLGAGLLAVVVGALNVKDFFAFGRGPSLSIPESAKPGIYRRAREVLQSGSTGTMIAATLLLAFTANFYELLCTAGFPMIYTRVLTLSEPSLAARYAYLALYNVVYVLPLLLMVLLFAGALTVHKLTEREGRLLKLASGVMMAELGLLLIFAPQWLGSLAATGALVGIAVAVTVVAALVTRGRGNE